MTAGSARIDADARLVSRLAAGDMDAASELYDRHAGRVLGLARRILRDHGDAEDVVQEVFSQAWRTAGRFEAGRGSVTGWLLVMARTRSLDRLRRKQSRPDTRPDALPDTMPSQQASASDLVLSDEQAVRVREALGKLPAVQRDALELAYFEGLTQSEIAERLTVPLGTIKARIRTALGTLRQTLRPA